jgi:hypothetical protein
MIQMDMFGSAGKTTKDALNLCAAKEFSKAIK